MRISCFVYRALFAVLFLLVASPVRSLRAREERSGGGSVSIIVEYEGSWRLRYKLYYQEIGDSEEREIYGFGSKEISVAAERKFVNICAWLTRTSGGDVREGMKLTIVAGPGIAARVSPPSLFGLMSSVCYHF